MNVLVLATDGFGGHGGIALYVRNMLTALCAHPSRPSVVAVPRVSPFEAEALPTGLRWDTSGLGGKCRYARAVARASLRRADIVFCTHFHLLPFAYPVAKLHRAPLVVWIYGVEVGKPTSHAVANRLVEHVDALVSIRTHTTAMLRTWAKLRSVRQHKLENAIDLSRYGIAPKKKALLERYGLVGKKIVMTLGRVEETHKGFDEMIEVMPKLAAAVPDIAYVVAGGGTDVERLKEKARAIGVGDRVVFTGLVSDAEKADHYRLADVYAMPGTGPEFDRYPLRFVFLEAMACGVPVVGCIPEDEEERRIDGALLAELVDPHDPDDIVRGILTALANGQRKIPAGLERFGFPAFQHRLHAIVDDVMSTRG